MSLKKFLFAITFISITTALSIAGYLYFAKSKPAQAQVSTNHYIRSNATGLNNGSDWNNAYTTLPATLIRGDIYYIADGDYGSYTFDDAVSGSLTIIVKKATIPDHGIDTGWDNAFGDGQAVLSSPIIFTQSYYELNGNGMHMLPSDNSSDYGIQIYSNSSTNIAGIIQVNGGSISNIIIKYVHVYNTTNGDINNGTVSLRFTGNSNHIKVQNCFLENSGKDGIQISSSSFVLIERSYIKRLGKLTAGTPDYHGQTVQLFYGGDDIVLRWNVWEANEGQGLVQIAARLDGNGPTDRVRFYSNVVFEKYSQNPNTPGFNTSGGMFGNAWNYNFVNGVYVYNNTIVNIGGDYGGVGVFRNIGPYTDWYTYNNLFYNVQSVQHTGWTDSGYHASGGGDTPGGISEQVGLNSSIFTNYTGNDFTLASSTNAGLTLTSQSWWNDDVDSFFGQLDSATDILGNTRGSDGVWDRGAYEYIQASPPLKGDFNSDSKVNDLDFTSFKNAFKSIFNSLFDLNSDNTIDVKDLGVLMSGWLE